MLIKGYSDFSLSKVGIKSSFVPAASWGAHFKLDNDVSELFPYINATFKDAVFYDKPEYIKFVIDGFQCVLYPDDVIAAPFTNRNQAIEFAERLIHFLNKLHTRKHSLKPNYKKFRPVSVIDIYRLLPGTNCKACGFSTCLAFAGALSRGQTTPDQCPGFTSPICENAIYPVYDKDGNLASTVAIETAPQNEQDSNKQKKYIESLEKKLAEEKQKRKISENEDIEIQTDLTDREIQVLCLVAEGATNAEISDTLFISPHTVKSHIINIFNKLNVNDRTRAAVWAVRNKIV
ncbi:LuxR C-terminal-related transcriptional regulator [Desulfonema magnum]|uniref:4Fe-4S cluster and LuxR domains-containing protein n=1 Tax=Desulfonema magnum TaxID=45655 RepID=A0A975GSD4_9BACT|nr:LuxR C-terminal-related transcriptional regulator [Desulfonema magnum]QTA90958.1 4Fe-4S cluster and LuxR domains-containing protein [Desulfonema magnum]